MRRFAPALRRVTFATVLAFVFLDDVSADPILLQTERQIHGLARVYDVFGHRTPEEDAGFSSFSGGTGPFSQARQLEHQLNGTAALSIASQTTNIAADGSRWFGSGSATAKVVRGNPVQQFQEADAESTIAVIFSLAQRTPYQFNATLSAGGDTFQNGLVLLERLGGVGPVWSFGAVSSMLEVDRSGFLSPGAYRFGARAESGGAIGLLGRTFGNSSFDFDFQLGSTAPTPEPASLMLTGVALVGAGVLRLRRSRPRRDV